mmetsp:Transcript_3137/g.19348  ORF Transcript_3137/g.19348 Transcript_3137/m.19348 type:complete len:324 (+) Transcript_3137:370-1341(+)
MANVLMVTTTMGMLHRVHCHTSNLGPAVPLHLVLVVCVSCFQQWLFCTTTASNLSDGCASINRHNFLHTGWKLDTGNPCLRVVRDDNGVVTRATCELSAVSCTLLHVADNRTFWHLSDWQGVSHRQVGLLTTVHELSGVHALRRDDLLLLFLVTDGVAEGHPCKRSTTSRIMDDLRHHALDVPIAFAEVQLAQLGWAFSVGVVTLEHASITLTLSADHASHPARSYRRHIDFTRASHAHSRVSSARCADAFPRGGVETLVLPSAAFLLRIASDLRPRVRPGPPRVFLRLFLPPSSSKRLVLVDTRLRRTCLSCDSRGLRRRLR